MKRSFFIVLLAFVIFFTSFSVNYNIIAQDSKIIFEDEGFIIEREYEKSFMYLVLKDKNFFSERLSEIYKKIDTYGKQINVETNKYIPIIEIMYNVYNTEIEPYFKLDKHDLRQINDIKNGWVSIEKNGYIAWYYRGYGNFKKGWHYDNEYEGWYYFVEMKDGNHLIFDPRYNDSTWCRIDNKWYKFNPGGKLEEIVGWKEYFSGRYFYHLEKDYGYLIMLIVNIDGNWYYFDSDGATDKINIDPVIHKKLVSKILKIFLNYV